MELLQIFGWRSEFDLFYAFPFIRKNHWAIFVNVPIQCLLTFAFILQNIFFLLLILLFLKSFYLTYKKYLAPFKAKLVHRDEKYVQE